PQPQLLGEGLQEGVAVHGEDSLGGPLKPAWPSGRYHPVSSLVPTREAGTLVRAAPAFSVPCPVTAPGGRRSGRRAGGPRGRPAGAPTPPQNELRQPPAPNHPPPPHSLFPR